MFDFHMHTTVSYDGQNTPLEMAQAAKEAGLKAICFTDHLDYLLGCPDKMVYTVEEYNAGHEGVQVPGLTILHGVEVGFTRWNKEIIEKELSLRHYDFVIGSLHVVDDEEPYFPSFWQGKTAESVERSFFEQMLEFIQLHDDFDVLGHLTYISKLASNPKHCRLELDTYRDVVEEILKVLVAKGKGLEVNTSGIDRIGDFLPGADYLRRFKELGGQIVTIGSDAHATDRVGQYVDRGLEMLKEIFGYVCTYENRQPVFHKL